MFEKSSTWQRVSGGSRKVIGVHLGYVPQLDDDSGEDRRFVRVAVAVALLAHLVFFLVRLPELRAVEIGEQRQQKVFVVKQIRFTPPLPPAQQQIPKQKKKVKKIPIPDPTPDDPEPLLVEELEVPEVDALEIGENVFGIPDGPPGPAIAGLGASGPYRPGGDVTPPVKIFDLSPTYTEEGRQNRVQGVVILETIVDSNGDVARVKVLKGLPLGLTESAVTTARQWKYRPATRFGEPVAVVMNVTVRFSLQ